MGQIANDIGEEYVLKTALASTTVDVGLYNDATDAITDTEDLTDITTEPSDGNYTRQTATLEVVDVSGNWAFRNNAQISFDVTNTTGTVDSYFFVANFTSVDAGDSAATDHLILTGSLSQSYDLSNIDTLNINSGSMGGSIT